MRHGRFAWNELNTWDPAASMRYYGATLGWTFDELAMPGGPYWIAKNGDEMAGGVFQLFSPAFDGVPDHWFAYIQVDDVDARSTLCEAEGGTLIRPPFDIPGVGRIAITKSPKGAVIGLMTPTPRD